MHDGGPAFLGGFEERIVATIDGLALYARDYAPLQPETGLPVICLHGLTRNSRDFEIVAPRIAALGRRVIAQDVRGRGRSANDPDPAHYVPAVYAQDVVKLMDDLGVARAVFVGTSMGALITMTLAAMAPDRIAAAVLNDIGPRIETAGLRRIGGYVGKSLAFPSWQDAAAAARAIAGAAYPARADDVAFWLSFARRTFRLRDDGQVEPDYDPHIALAFSTPEETAPTPDLTPLFQALASKPVLSVRGEISDLLSAEGVAHMKRVKPDLATIVAANTGHAPMLEEPEVWDALLNFLARVE